MMPPRALWMSALLVISTALLTGHLACSRGPADTAYPLNLGPALWIEPASPGADAYFTKLLYVSSPAREAWLALAAPGCAYTVTVNGELIENSPRYSREAATVVDIGPRLHVGTNAIAIQLRSGDYRMAARLAAAGGYRDFSGREEWFRSDATWFAASHEPSRGTKTSAWYLPGFELRTPAIARGPVRPDAVPRFTLPLEVMVRSAPRRWLGTPEPSSKSITFSTQFAASAATTGAWIRLASRDGHILVVNGHALAGHSLPPRTFEVVVATPYLRRGVNHVDVRVESQSAAPRLAADILVADDRGVHPALPDDTVWWLREQTRFRGRPPEPGDRRAILCGEAFEGGRAIERLVTVPEEPVLFAAQYVTKRLALMALVLLLAVADWLLAAALLHRASRSLSFTEALVEDALLRAPLLLGLLTLVLASYDVREDPAVAFQGGLLALGGAALLALRALLLAGHAWPDRWRPRLLPRGLEVPPWLRRWSILGVLLLLLAAGWSVRWAHARSKPFDHDEISIVLAAEKVLRQGYPSRSVGLLEKPLTSYELVPYPIAVAVGLFGKSELTARLPALLWGAGTFVLLFVAGASTWSTGVGLLAASVYALSPYSIAWGTHAFHPQQTQFFSLLCVTTFWRSISGSEARPLHLYVAALAFTGAYLSWEGTGFLVPALLLGMVSVRGHRQLWLRSRHLWIAAGLAAAVVAGQQANRILANVPYIVVGSGLSVRSFTLAFLDALYDPAFYPRVFLLPEHHVVLAVALLLGLPFLLRDRAARYYVVLMAALLVMLGNLLTRTSSRYVYFLQPLLILAAAASIGRLCGSVLDLARQRPCLPRASARVLAVGLPLLVLGATSDLIFMPHRLGAFPDRITTMAPEFRGFDYRAAAHVVEAGHQPGDVIISLMPHTLAYYTGLRTDYYLQSLTNRLIFYDPDGSQRYMDRFVGAPVLRSAKELQDVLNRHPRAWILATPESAFQVSNDPTVLAYIGDTARVVFESYNVRVYLWSH